MEILWQAFLDLILVGHVTDETRDAANTQAVCGTKDEQTIDMLRAVAGSTDQMTMEDFIFVIKSLAQEE